MAFLDELTAFLGDLFPGAELRDFGVVPRGGKVGGVIAWDGFQGMALIDRQDKLWAALRERFSREQLRQISMIMAFTPAELQAIHEDA